MIYIDSVKFLELIAESGRSESKFCRDAGISRQSFYRLAHHGGRIMVSTVKKVVKLLGFQLQLCWIIDALRPKLLRYEAKQLLGNMEQSPYSGLQKPAIIKSLTSMITSRKQKVMGMDTLLLR